MAYPAEDDGSDLMAQTLAAGPEGASSSGDDGADLMAQTLSASPDATTLRSHTPVRKPVRKPIVTRTQAAIAAHPAPVLTKPGSKDIDWGKVGQSALKNAPESLWNNLVVAPFQAVTHPKQTIKTMVELGGGASSKLAGLAGNNGWVRQTPEQKAKAEAMINALGHDYAMRYGLHGAAPAAEALANDPGGYAGDALTVATLPFGGEGAAAEVPGVMGKAAKAISVARNGARTVAEYTNPISLAAKGVKAVVKPAMKATKALPEAMRAASPAGRMTAATFDTPEAQQILKDVVKKKGATPEAMVEANLKTFGAPTPNSAVRGQKPLAAQLDTDRAAVQEAKGAVAEHVQNMVGGEPPSLTGMGEALHGAHAESFNNVANAYKQAFSHEGNFSPAFADSFPDAMKEALSGPNSTLPNTVAEMSRAPEVSYPRAKQVMPWVQDKIAELGAADNLTMQNLEGIRQLVNDAWSQADRAGATLDKKALAGVKSALDTHIENMANAGDFAGSDGRAIVADMRNARQSYRQHQDTFGSGPIKSAVKQLMDEQDLSPDRLIETPPTEGATEKAHATLAKNLLDMRSKQAVVKPGAHLLYNQLADALGDDGVAHVNEHLRKTLGAVTQDGQVMSLAHKPDALHSALDHPLGQTVFSPEEQNLMRRAAEAQRSLTAKPVAGAANETPLMNTVHRVGSRVIGAGMGATLGHVVPVIGEPVGAFIGERIAEGMNKSRGARQAARALEGAQAKPFLAGTRNVIGGVADNAARSGPAMMRPAMALNQGAPESLDATPDDAPEAIPYEPVKATPNDRDALIRMIYGEARGEPDEGKIAAAQTFINRSKKDGRPIYDEVHALNASEAMTSGVDHGLRPDSEDYQRIGALVDAILSGETPDYAQGALYFYNPELQAKNHAQNPSRYKAHPDFAIGDGIRYGNHVFYGEREGHAEGGKVNDDNFWGKETLSNLGGMFGDSNLGSQVGAARSQAIQKAQQIANSALPPKRVQELAPAPQSIVPRRTYDTPLPMGYYDGENSAPPAFREDPRYPDRPDAQRVPLSPPAAAPAPIQRQAPLPVPVQPQPKPPVVPQGGKAMVADARTIPTEVLDWGAATAKPKPNVKRTSLGQNPFVGTMPPNDGEDADAGAAPARAGAFYDPSKVTEADRDAMARLMLSEAGGEPLEGRAAVVQTFLNRAKKSGKSIYNEIYKPWASEAMTTKAGDKFSKKSDDYKDARKIVDQVINGDVSSSAPDAVNFYAPKLQKAQGRKDPAWARNRTDGVTIGNMIYYPDRQARKSGGRVHQHEHLVSRLMSLAEDAKKASNRHTEPLLKEHDDAIAKALHVAQRAI